MAGCLAVGGGATYCVEQGVDPIAGIRTIASREQPDRKPKPISVGCVSRRPDGADRHADGPGADRDADGVGDPGRRAADQRAAATTTDEYTPFAAGAAGGVRADRGRKPADRPVRRRVSAPSKPAPALRVA